MQQSNEKFEALFRMVEEVDPDLFVVLEIDEAWDEALAEMGQRFPHRTQYIREGDASGAFGMHLLSRHPLVTTDTLLYFGNDTPRSSPMWRCRETQRYRS